jgi:hypothetical protein
MKTTSQNIGKLLTCFVLTCCIVSFSPRAFAIEGIQVSIQSSNVVLSWPSDPSETYVVQYRPSLTSTNGWQMLTASLAAAPDTNITYFIHTNAVQYGFTTGGGATNSGGGDIDPNGTNVVSGTNGLVITPGTGFYQAARLGVHIIGVDNFTNVVSNSIAIPFEVANDIGSIQDIVVLVDGARYRGADPVVPPGISGNIAFDTSFLENGSHTVQVLASWLNPDGTDLNNLSITRYSDSFTLTVSNVIYYPNWEDEIGELGFAYYSFETTCTNSTWQIDIYDVSNRLAKTLSGYTGDGFIETNWNLVDTNGITRATNDADGEFSAIITVGDPVTKAAPKQRKSFAYPNQGQWVIAFQEKFGSVVNSNSYESDISSFGGIAAPNGGAVSTFPTAGHPEYGQTFPMRYNYTNNPSPPTGLQIIADEKALITLLTNRINRNFYFNGHAQAEGIATLNSQRISIALERHYYRFVFLDGCSTANGSLPASFGINYSSTQPLSYFQAHGTRPRTFIGYTKDVFFAEVGDYHDSAGNDYPYHIPDRNLYFLSNFEFYWYFNYDLSTAIYNAQNDTPDLRYGWEDGADLNVFGYAGLYINQYNYQTDWSN